MAGKPPATHAYGFIGLGQMGGPMAANIARAGFSLRCFDVAGTAERLPSGALGCDSLEELARSVATVFLSLPDGKISQSVCEQIAALGDRSVSLIIDLSTVGPQSARATAKQLSAAGIEYADAPVSGGRGGAIAATISLMWAGSVDTFAAHRAVIDSFTGNAFCVGNEPGQGQALKLLNNFLSATAMAATSEAIHFGLSQGLDMKTMLDVVNVSSGQNTATKDKFPKRVLTETYDAGFSAALMNKDVQLFLQHVHEANTPAAVGQTIGSVWSAFDSAAPGGADFTLIHKHLANKKSQ